jgi:hypothetical protein
VRGTFGKGFRSINKVICQEVLRWLE